VKPDPETLSTVPAVPPSAGPDRALDPPPPGPEPLGAAPLGAAVLDAIPDELLLEPGWALVQAPISRAIATAPAVMEPGSVRECMEKGPFLRWPDSQSLGHARLIS
jgi:hypothetical protein